MQNHLFKRIGLLMLLATISVLLVTVSPTVSPLAAQPPQHTVRQAVPTDMQGVWQTEGYGYHVVLDADEVRVYQASYTDCVLNGLAHTEDIEFDEGELFVDLYIMTIEEIRDFFDIVLRLDGDTLLLDMDGVFPVRASRVEAIPPLCQTLTTVDPVSTFNYFWEIFDAHYAFFELYDVDWQSQRNTYITSVTNSTTPDELLAVLLSMVEPLVDGHIEIVTADDEYSPGFTPAWGQDDDDIEALIDAIDDTYLIDDMTWLASEYIGYSRIEENIGYLLLLSTDEFSEAFDDLDDEDVLASALREIVTVLSDVDVMVIDNRFNPGGSDKQALMIAGAFAEARTLAFRKSVYEGGEIMAPGDVYVEPLFDDGTGFDGEVVLLNSRYAASAAEILSMAFNGMDDVMVIGERTNGILSDALTVVLPNGWLVGLSNEIYTSHDGNIYERVGVPPDIEVMMDPAAILTGDDPIMDRALEWIGN